MEHNASSVEKLLARHSLQGVHTATGERVSYRENGAGSPLVLLHGISSGSGSFVHQLEGLATRHRVIAWDAPGYGESTPLRAAAPSVADYACSLAALLDALGLSRVTLVGHSLGAIVATRFAADAAASVDRLLLLNPARGYGNAPPEIREKKLDERLAAMARLGPAQLALQRCDALLSANASQAARELVVANASRLVPAGYAQAARMLADADVCADARGYPGPVLVACGSEDGITPEAACREIALAFPNAEYRSLPGLGHASYIENPEAVNAIVAEFAGEALAR